MYIRRSVAVIASAGLGATTAAASALSASSSTRPVVYNGQHGWRPNGLPRTIVLQKHHGRVIAKFISIHWQSGSKATARLRELESDGRWHTHPAHRPGELVASDVKVHNGIRYYAHLDLRYSGWDWAYVWRNGHWSVRTSSMNVSLMSWAASTAPVIYGTFGDWRGPRVEPRSQTMGAMFVLLNMRWKVWARTYAKAGGTDQWANGAAGKIHNWPSTITLYRVRTHKGQRYYSRMTIASHGHRTMHLVYWGGKGGWFQH